MNSKLVVALIGLALVVGIVLFAFSGERDGRARGGGRAEAVQRREAPPVALVEPEAAAAPVPTVERVLAQPATAATPLAVTRSGLAGLTGRVIESDGTPVGGMRVSLVELDSMLMFDGSALGEAPPSFEVDETVTSSEGRFVLDGARNGTIHALGVDLGGARATVRMIEHALANGERTDVGDVVLAPFGVLTGRVVDSDGAPVPGARVRAAQLPEEIVVGKPWELREETLLCVNRSVMGSEGHQVIELPAWVRQTIDRLPFPTTYTAADGSFRLEGVPLARVVGGIDKAEHVGVAIGPLDMSEGDQDLGEVVLAAGRTIQGVVEDAWGEPAAGIEVWAGAEVAPMFAYLQPCGRTNEDGEFELTGVHPDGQVVAATRRNPHEPWATAATSNAENVLIEIPSTMTMAVTVVDELGAPLSGARLELAPGFAKKGTMGFSEALALIPRPASPADAFREVEPGRYVAEGLTTGAYDVTARVAGRAPGLQSAECTAEINEVTVVCTSGKRLELTVVDAVTKAPVEDARASLLQVGASGFRKLAVERTDADGRASLTQLPDPSLMPPSESFMPRETMLHVQHPSYGDGAVKLETILPELVVELESGGTLAGRVHWGGATPTRLYMLVLEYRGADGFMEAFHMPRFGLTGLEGEFRVGSLPPGQYEVQLMERFLDQDPFGMMNDDFSVPTLYSEEVEIRNGETTQLVIDLTPTGRGALARVVGHVRVDGRNLEGAEVTIRGNERVTVTTDSSGRFETPEFSVRGSTSIRIEGDVRLADRSERRMRLHDESVELAHEDVHEINLDLYPMKLEVRVVDGERKAPVANASVNLQSADNRNRGFRDDVPTDSTGTATLLVLQAGDYTVNASADGFARGSTKVTVAEAGMTEPAVVELPPSVPCRGRVVLDVAPEARNSFSYIWVRGENTGASGATRLTAPEYTFDIVGLGPDTYKAHLYIDGQQGVQQTFELGPLGNADLTISFTPDGN